MTHRLDLTPDLEAKLQALATRRGTDAAAAALQLVAEGLRDVDVDADAPKPRRPLQGRGRYSDLRSAAPGLTVDALLQERHEESRREMEREDALLSGILVSKAART